MVVGLGIKRQDDRCRFLDAQDWRAILAVADPDLSRLDGHFVVVRRRGDVAEAFTDPLGIRKLSVCKSSHGIAFATRLDLLVRFLGRFAIDFGQFGAHWLAVNQMSTDSQLQGIERVGPGGHLRIKEGQYSVASKRFTARFNGEDPRGSTFERTLSAYCRPAPNERVSIGLSGGFDSRLILAVRPSGPAHVIGHADHPDVRVAQHIADAEDVDLTCLYEEAPGQDQCLAMLTHWVTLTQVVAPAHAPLRYRWLPAMGRRGLISIDGAGGEMARRNYMNKVVHMGKRALRRNQAATVLELLRVPRAGIFNKDAVASMTHGAIEQITRELEALPTDSRLSAENLVDLLCLRTRIPNFFGFAQAWLDEALPAYMPFSQPAVLRAAMQVPLRLRRNGRLFMQIISSRHPRLATYPLAKGFATYPYGTSKLAAWALMRVKKGVGRVHQLTESRQFLERVRPFALDVAHSSSVRNYHAYDPPRIARLVTEYYSGDIRRAQEVEWWLTFEMWRRMLTESASSPLRSAPVLR